MSRIESKLALRYRKDINDEKFLAKFNEILAPYQEQDYHELPETHPTLFIIGVARSGTTLLSQLIASHTDIGYINNLMAAFWRAPVYGIQLSKKLIPPNTTSAFESEFGRTKSINEPHEFGYFWSSVLQYHEMLERDEATNAAIDWQHLQRILINMTYAWGGPMMFKPLLLGWHIKHIQNVLHKSCWIHIKRDPVQNALSLLNTRSKFLGSINNWVSLKPKEYSWLKDLSNWHQVAGQVYFLNKQHETQIHQVPIKNVLSISYAELCESPMLILKKIQTLLYQHGSEISIVGNPPPRFNHQERPLNSIDAKQITEAWQTISTYGYAFE